MTILNWPITERPRERLMKFGAATLSDAELLAVYLRTGFAGTSAVDLARQLLSRFNGLHGLFGASRPALLDVKGLGPAKYCQLQAVLEMARRVLRQELATPDAMSNPQAIKQLLVMQLGNQEFESFHVLFLNNQHQLLADEELFRGTLTQASVYPREVVKAALRHNAAAVVLAHNHPSGVCEASPADRQLTTLLQQALKLVEVRVLDHIIVARNLAVSFVERGWL